jgi:AsmA protein
MVRISRRLILGGIAALVGLLVIGVAALLIAALAIDPNRLKPRIQKEFAQRTGRELRLEGDLAWRFFPWIVIRSGGGVVGNPEGFDGGQFASWKSLRLGVQLLPLFDRQVIVDRIEIDGLDLTLVKRADGVGNWTAPDLTPGGEEAPADGGKPVTLQFAVDQVHLSDARLAWRDVASAQAWQAENLAVSLRIPGRATLQHAELRDIGIKGRLGGTPLRNVVEVAFEAQRLDFQGEPLRLRLPAWKGAFAGAALEGGIDAVLGGPDRRLDGRINGRVESLREVLRAVGTELPPTRDRDVFGNVEIDTSFALDEGRVATESLNVRLDDTHFRGSIERQPIEDGVIRFVLIGDTIDVSRYLRPRDDPGEPFELKLGPLKRLKAVGELRIDEARMGGAVVHGMTVNVE